MENTSVHQLRNVKWIVALAILLCNFSIGFAQEEPSSQNTTSTEEKKDDYEGTIRLEVMGRSPFVGLGYDQRVVNQEVDLHFTAGFSGTDEVAVVNVSSYFKWGSKRVKPMAGLGAMVDLSATFNAGTIYILFENIYATPFLGIDFDINKKFDIQLYYNPLFNLNQGSFNPASAGINFGYAFSDF